MSKIRRIASHLTMILALMFITFLILDEFNPLMNFTDHPISRGLLAAMCICAIGQHVMTCIEAARGCGKAE